MATWTLARKEIRLLLRDYRALVILLAMPLIARPALGELLTRAMRTRTGRVGILVAWAWIGLHFFAR